jgi:signal peptidase II
MARVTPKRYLLFLVPAVVGLTTDLATKSWFFSWRELQPMGSVYWLWPDHAGFQLSWNEGALFGMGQGKVWLFVALSLTAAIAIPVWLFKYQAARDAWLTFALGCVMGGILGNLFDRMGLHGEVWPAGDPRAGETVHAVRDWILWQLNNEWRWPNFNIADSLLVTGAALMFVHALRHPHAAASETAREKATPVSGQ